MDDATSLDQSNDVAANDDMPALKQHIGDLRNQVQCMRLQEHELEAQVQTATTKIAQTPQLKGKLGKQLKQDYQTLVKVRTDLKVLEETIAPLEEKVYECAPRRRLRVAER